MQFKIEESGKIFDFHARKLFNAGYTGREQESVKKHVKELKQMGISAPETIPCFFPKPAGRMMNNGFVDALDADCKSESEFVILVGEDDFYISIGCDVFDSRVESFQADKSKMLYPNYIAEKVWKYSDIKNHWDKIKMRSWMGKERHTLYQEGEMSDILSVEQIVSKLEETFGEKIEEGTVIYSGTWSCLVEGMPFTDYFETELYDPILDRRILCGYEIKKVK